MTQITQEAIEALCRPIIGIEDRTAQEAQDIMADRIRSFLSTLPIAVEAPEGWQLVPVAATIEMEHAAVARVKPFHDEDWYRIMPKDLFRLAWKALLAAAPVPPSSPGKDGGQEVEAADEPVLFVSEQQLPTCIGTYLPTRKHREGNFQMPLYTRPQPASAAQETEAVAKLVYEAMRIAAHECDPDREKPQWVEGGNSLMQDQARRIARSIVSTQPASTALVERLTKALEPFALAATIFEQEYGDWMKPDTGCNIKFSALCAARSALADTKGGSDQ